MKIVIFANGHRARRLVIGRWAVVLFPMLLLAGCSGKGRDGPKPVAECEAYEAALTRCTGVHTPFASQPEAMASSEVQRTQLKELCLQNMVELKQACR
jgi:hypothetical protein